MTHVGGRLTLRVGGRVSCRVGAGFLRSNMAVSSTSMGTAARPPGLPAESTDDCRGSSALALTSCKCAQPCWTLNMFSCPTLA